MLQVRGAISQPSPPDAERITGLDRTMMDQEILFIGPLAKVSELGGIIVEER
jgi:hypothetical protein